MNKTLLLGMVFLVACAPSQREIKSNALPAGRVSFRGSQILVDNKPFAELRCLNRKPSIVTSTTSICASGLGISIFYFENAEEKWIYPPNGWAAQNECISLSDKPTQSLTQVTKSWNGYTICGSKTAAVLTYASNIRISNEGREIIYTVPGFLADTTYAYDVENGMRKRIRRRWANQIF